MAKKGIQMYFDVREQDGTYGGPDRCDLCRQRFDSHGYHVVVHSGGWHEDWHSVICGGCFNTDPKIMADAFERRAPILGKTRDRDGEDPGTNIRRANSMLSIAEDLWKVKSLKELDGGIIAVKMMEAYREIEGQPKATESVA